MLSGDIHKDRFIEFSYNPEFMEMDGTYAHNFEILLSFTYGGEPESIHNVNKYNRKGPAVTINALNCFKERLKTCAVACGLNRQLKKQLTFHSNKYTCGKVDNSKGTFVRYKWTNISISKMY